MNSQMNEIMEFIKTTSFSGYQKVVLPSGQVIPGADRSGVADLMFPENLEGKSILDVGCYYGYFLHNAVERGARRAVGVEPDPERYRIASKFAPLWNGKIEIISDTIEKVSLDEKFDYVLLLNVLHHIKDPVAVMKKLAGLCKGIVVVEFRQPYDTQFIIDNSNYLLQSDWDSFARAVRFIRRIKATVPSWILKIVTKNRAIIGVGSIDYHRMYYFNKLAFRNVFFNHHKIFENIKFRSSLKSGQVLAFCDCNKNSTEEI